MGRMIKTTVLYPNGHLAWVGDAPLLPEGHRINFAGKSYKVSTSVVDLETLTDGLLIEAKQRVLLECNHD